MTVALCALASGCAYLPGASTAPSTTTPSTWAPVTGPSGTAQPPDGASAATSSIAGIGCARRDVRTELVSIRSGDPVFLRVTGWTVRAERRDVAFDVRPHPAMTPTYAPAEFAALSDDVREVLDAGAAGLAFVPGPEDVSDDALPEKSPPRAYVTYASATPATATFSARCMGTPAQTFRFQSYQLPTVGVLSCDVTPAEHTAAAAAAAYCRRLT